MSFDAQDDLCLGFWKQVYDAGHVPLPHGAKVLEVGCSEADWLTPMKAARPDLYLVGLDWRRCARPGADLMVTGDVLTQDFQSNSFDAVVMISALEHIGLGGYNDDPLDEAGDTHTLERIQQWLKPGGLCYFDVPYREHGPYEVRGKFRVYDKATRERRLNVQGLKEVWSEVIPSEHIDGPYLAVVLQNA